MRVWRVRPGAIAFAEPLPAGGVQNLEDDLPGGDGERSERPLDNDVVFRVIPLFTFCGENFAFVVQYLELQQLFGGFRAGGHFIYAGFTGRFDFKLRRQRQHIPQWLHDRLVIQTDTRVNPVVLHGENPFLSLCVNNPELRQDQVMGGELLGRNFIIHRFHFGSLEGFFRKRFQDFAVIITNDQAGAIRRAGIRIRDIQQFVAQYIAEPQYLP